VSQTGDASPVEAGAVTSAPPPGAPRCLASVDDVSETADIPNVLTDELRELLRAVATATLTAQLQQRGLRNTFLSGLRPLLPGQRLVGRARTLRYVALREDVLDDYGSGLNAQRRAAEATEPGDVLVIEARDVADAGTVGDIYAMRSYALGGVGIVTDGALRDTGAIAALGRPVYHRASHGATWGRRHMPFSNDEPITCAGVFVIPGDVIVGDDDGVVVVPMALVDEVARAAAAQEEREEFAAERVRAGESTVGLFPLSAERHPDFEAWQALRRG
jgi:5-oxopent-3-ene-1,2,5-tricarboxylate decarboxylase/2-hydroxyhepta-2,4-diene-1,7-dioate isomerase